MVSDVVPLASSTPENLVGSEAVDAGADNPGASNNINSNGPCSLALFYLSFNGYTRLTSESGRSHSKSLTGAPSGGVQFPPPKTDKPRPHICATCTRSFARLEHLKRHERSHTKEKPFECPECTRCFARRDLLLRHQQKLHMTAMPSTRQRGSRRESTSSATGGTGRVRKSSVANNAGGSTAAGGAGSMRPRANTISHVDNATLGMLAAANSNVARSEEMNFGARHFSGPHGLPGVGGYTFRGMSTAAGNHGNPHVLPKIDTHGISLDMSASLHTAPAYGGLGSNVDMQNLWYGPGTTVNPAQLHFADSPQSFAFDTPASPYHQGFAPVPAPQSTLEEDNNFGWLHGFDHQLSFGTANEQAIDNSSPSANSSGSHDGMSEIMLDGSNNPISTSSMWQLPLASQTIPSDYSMDFTGPAFSDLFPPGQVSPKSLQARMHIGEQYFSSPPPMTPQAPFSMLQGLNNPFCHPPMVTEPETPSNSAASISSSNRHSSITSLSADSITDATRQAMLTSLSQSLHYGHHLKNSQPPVSSPLSQDHSAKPRRMSNVPLPSTYDLQRYVAAYIQYFHPHLPFLHIPSLAFDSPVFTSSLRASSGSSNFSQPGVVGGGGALILAMAAIGAFYEYDTAASKDLFEMAKKMIHVYLDERRKAHMAAAVSGCIKEEQAQDTPLWLVQAMLLNVIYGHNCGDKTSAGIASTHCAALVSLARAAELAIPPVIPSVQMRDLGMRPADIEMVGNEKTSDIWNTVQPFEIADPQGEWQEWKLAEERKRTLYAVFILSSLLVSAYNHAPALMNSEIRLDLPCDEELWAAESADSWRFLGGGNHDEQRPMAFASALSHLLTASQREQYQHHRISQSFSQPFGSGIKVEDLPVSEIRPSTFGCLILINALHNYIWETRERHMGRQWTTQETEAMHGHVEPALRAWQAAWASNPQHSVERPNPSGLGSLSADCIPMLDLAYVRLFVNLGSSKEAFFNRDFGAMAEELAQGREIIQHADHSGAASPGDTSLKLSIEDSTDVSPTVDGSKIKLENSENDFIGNHSQGQQSESSAQSSKRERHLRKAAFYAAYSLAMSDKLGVTFADFDSRELPMSSAMCAIDCAQVVAEWVSAVQQRVGPYLGILGKDEVEYAQVPAIMLLEDEDIKLLEKINEVLHSAELKLANNGITAGGLPSIIECGYGSKILTITAVMLEKAAVWPVTLEAAQSLRTQAAHVQQRAEDSIRNGL
ncbi:MAG: hypothetical protein Q9195_002810 [Heterodermia aff. obscurata]